MDWLRLQPTSIPALTQVLLAAVILLYLLTIRQKSRTTWLLVFTFGGFVGYLFSLFMELSVVAAWAYVFRPLQYVFGLTAFALLIRFAYVFLDDLFPREARLVTAVTGLIAAGTSAWIFARLLARGAAHGLPFERLLLGVLVLAVWSIAVFVRKSRQGGPPRQGGAHRAFALVYAFILATVVAAFLRDAGLLTWAQANAVSAISFLLYFFGFVLVYVNHTPEPTTFQVKLVGLALVTMLAVLSVVALGLYTEADLQREAASFRGLDAPLALDDPAYRAYAHLRLIKMAYAVLYTTVFILIAFPFFYRASLLRRLDALLDGFRRVDAGDLEVAVPVTVKDELGFLAGSFNRMAASLKAQIDEIHTLSEQMMAQERRARQIELERRLLEAENARKTKELEEARQLQLSMLPKELPRSPHADFAAFMQTATEVGGDYYDFHRNPDGSLTIAIGDATGHGLRAGTMVTATKSLFHSLAEDPDLVHVLRTSTHALKWMNLPRLYMAFALARLADNRLDIAGAGLPPALHYHAATGTITEVSLKGMPLGSFPDFPYHQTTLTLAPSDVLLLLSDGFPELFNPAGEMLGYGRAATLLAEVAHGTPDDIIAHLVRTAEAWSADRPTDDDITFVVLKMRPAGEQAA